MSRLTVASSRVELSCLGPLDWGHLRGRAFDTSDPVSGMDRDQPREVRLRPEYGEIYQDMPAGQWLPAARWAHLIVVRAQQARARQVHQRTFDPRHFEFRGGEPPRGPDGSGLRTRADDP